MNMSRSAAAAAVLITGLLGFAPRVASAAQAETEAARSRSALRCESTGTYQRCPAASTWRGARLVQQISSNPCIQGRTWGFDSGGVWVTSGCRAEFILNPR